VELNYEERQQGVRSLHDNPSIEATRVCLRSAVSFKFQIYVEGDKINIHKHDLSGESRAYV